jgi:5-methylthioadenosine/S-adenosylhomocysteine deaminase
MGERADLLVTGGDVVTMDDARTVVTGGAVVVRGGAVVAVVSTDAARAAHPGVSEHDATGCLVLPGFVDAHQHLTGDRLVRCSIPDGIAAEEAVLRWAVPVHAHHGPDDDDLSATLACAEALRNGVTTVIEAGTVAHPQRVAAAMQRTGIRGGIGTWGWDAPGQPHAAPPAEVVARQEAVLDAWPAGGRVEGWVTLVGHDLTSDELLVAATDLARRRGARVTFHISPDERDGDAFVARTGHRPIEWLHRLGVLGPHLLLAHAARTSEAERDQLLTTRTAVASCPWAYLRLAQGLPVHHADLCAMGGRIALGCDSENAGDQIDVLRAAALFAGLAGPAVRAADALALATCRGAEAVGLGDRVGSITPGRRADLVVLSPPRPRGADPALECVWGTDGRSVRDVLVDGRLVVRDGVLTMVDEAAALEAAEERRRHLVARAGLPLARRP